MRITKLLLQTTFILIVLLLTGCQTILPSNEQVELNYYSHNDENGERHEIINEFERKYPNVKVNLIELPKETNRKLAMLIELLQAENGAIDVFDSDVVWPATFASAGWVEPLDGFLSKNEIDEFLPGAMFSNEYMGKYYGIPYRTDSGILYYRKDLLDKYDYEIPKTWTELVEISNEIMEKEGTEMSGYAGSWKQSEGLTCNLTEFIWSYGGKVLDEYGNVVLKSQETIDAVSMMVGMKNTYGITPVNVDEFTSGKVREEFKKGNLIFLRDWPLAWNNFQDDDDSNISGLVGVAQLPTGNEDGHSYSTLGGWQIMVSSSSNHKYEAIEFAKFRASKVIQIKMAKALNHIPSRIDLYRNAEVLQAMPFLADMYPAIKNAYPRPKSPYYSELSRILQSEIQAAFDNNKTPEEAVVNADKRIKALLGQS